MSARKQRAPVPGREGEIMSATDAYGMLGRQARCGALPVEELPLFAYRAPVLPTRDPSKEGTVRTASGRSVRVVLRVDGRFHVRIPLGGRPHIVVFEAKDLAAATARLPGVIEAAEQARRDGLRVMVDVGRRPEPAR